MTFILFLSDCLVPLVLFYIVGFGVLAGRPVFDDFIDGAKEGMKTVAGLLPTLAGLMIAVGVLRSSGLLEFLGEVLKSPSAVLHIPEQVVPVILVRLVSNAAAMGLVFDIFKQFGTDSYIGMVVSILMSCTETIFYTMSVYFMTAKVTKTRWTLVGALAATAGGIGASLFLAGKIL